MELRSELGLKGLERTGAETGYLNYREMLQTQSPDFVAICPRHADQRVAIEAACEFGAKAIYVENHLPEFRECRLISKRAKDRDALAVAHRNRYHPAFLWQETDAGLLGPIDGRSRRKIIGWR